MEPQETTEAQESLQQNQQSETDPVQDRSSGKKKPVIRILIIVVVLALLGAGTWYLLSSPEKSLDSLVSKDNDEGSWGGSESSTVTFTPTPTFQPVDKSEIKIELLNGTGIAGEASLVQTELEELGYSDITVGNADDQDHEETQVTFSSELPQGFIEEFVSELEGIYSDVSSKISASLEDYDIQIIAGLRSSYTPAPTKAPVSTATPTPQASITTTPTPTNTPTPTVTPTPTP
ncbi:LytR C-terminal domain-containing protein [Candidatus Woesebacteria bacterium]|nr:LytR C-terminal domain-containing protein [Candidatus Woesebacteria bacterium]